MIKQVHQKNLIFVTIGIFLDKGFMFQWYVCNGCHDVLWCLLRMTMSINLEDISVLDINSADYCCITNGISKSDAVNLLQNADLTKKWVL